MLTSELITKLEHSIALNGDVPVTCTGSTLPDNHGGVIPDVFETSVENIILADGERGKRIRIYM
jgi:hypothetical protein